MLNWWRHVHILIVIETGNLWRLLRIVRINGNRITGCEMVTFVACVRRWIDQSTPWLALRWWLRCSRSCSGVLLGLICHKSINIRSRIRLLMYWFGSWIAAWRWITARNHLRLVWLTGRNNVCLVVLVEHRGHIIHLGLCIAQLLEVQDSLRILSYLVWLDLARSLSAANALTATEATCLLHFCLVILLILQFCILHVLVALLDAEARATVVARWWLCWTILHLLLHLLLNANLHRRLMHLLASSHCQTALRIIILVETAA